MIRRTAVVIGIAQGMRRPEIAAQAGFTHGQLSEVSDFAPYERAAMKEGGRLSDFGRANLAETVVSAASMMALLPPVAVAQLTALAGQALRRAQGPGGQVVRGVGAVAQATGTLALGALEDAHQLSALVAKVAGETQDWLSGSFRSPTPTAVF